MAKKKPAGRYAILIVVLAVAAGGIGYALSISQGAKEKGPSQASRTGEKSASSESARSEVSASSTTSTPSTPSTSKDNEASTEPKDETKDANTSGNGATPEKNLGFVTRVYDEGGKRFLRIDYVQLLGGAEAAKALIEDGGCTGTIEECVPPNDYYLRNKNPKIRTFEISKAADILIEMPATEGPDGRLAKKAISYETFKSYFDGSETNESSAPYWITVGGGVVTDIQLMYTP